MANRWGIPKEVEIEVTERDQACVYCRVMFSENKSSRKTNPSREHIVNDIRINGSCAVWLVIRVKEQNFWRTG